MSEMVMIEDEDLNIVWECTSCAHTFEDSESFEDQTICPNCGQTIQGFVYIEDEE